MRSNYLFPKARSRLAPSLLPPPVQRGGSGEASGRAAPWDLGRGSEDRAPQGRARADNRPPVSGPMTFLGIFLTVLVPILIVAGFGYLLARLRLVDASRGLSRVSLYVLLPALTFSAMAKSDLQAREFASLVACAWLVAGLQAGIAAFVSRRLEFNQPEEGGFLLSVMTVNAGDLGIPLNHLALGPGTLVPATIYYVATLLVTYVGGILVTAPSGAGLRRALGQVFRMPII